MKFFVLLLTNFLLTTLSVFANTEIQLLITKVQTDSVDGTGGTKNDVIQIFNPSDVEIDLAAEGIRVERWTAGGTKEIVLRFDDANDAELHQTLIPAQGFFLIVDADADDEDLLDAADALVVRSFSLADDAAVAIGTDSMTDGVTDEDVIDLLGWGENAWFEGSAAAGNPPEGQVLSRKTDLDCTYLDSDDNFSDFEITTVLDLENSSFICGEEIQVLDTTAPITTISPEAGYFPQAQTLTFSSDEEATTFYSFDAEAEQADFLEYSELLEITENTTLRFFSVDLADNTEEMQTAEFIIDSDLPVFPDEAEFIAEAGDGYVQLSWSEASDDYFDAYYLQIDSGEWEHLGDALSVQKNLENGQEYVFTVAARDLAGNEVTLSAVATPSGPEIFTTAESGEVLINEVAWAGSTASSSDEWIELLNTTENKIFDLTGWQIVAEDESPTIDLSGELKMGDFFLLERTDDDSVLDVAADQIYTGGLGNGGEVLVLLDSEGNEIDRVDGSNSWEVGGNSDARKTLQRANLDELRTPFEANGNPGTANFLANDLNLTDVTLDPSNPIPGEEVRVTVQLENRGLENQSNFELRWLVNGEEIQTETVTQEISSFANLTRSFTNNFAAGSYVIEVQLMTDTLTLGRSVELDVTEHVLISEFMPDCEGSDAEGEWIELWNPSDEMIDLTGFELNGVTLSEVIEAGAYLVFFSTLEGWDTLTNTSGEISLLDVEGNILDSQSYTNPVEGRSFARSNEDVTQWTELWHATPGAENIEINSDPEARITIQGSGKNTGACSLFVNLTAEDSIDADGDELEFEWDFGNGNTSDEENPGGFYFSPGTYEVRLMVTDVLGATAEVTEFFGVDKCSSRSASEDTVAVEVTEELIFDSISADRVQLKLNEISFNSVADWIEVFVVDDGNNGRGIDIGGFYFEVDKRIKTIPKGTKLATGDFLLLTFKSEEKDAENLTEDVWKLYSTKSGLTKTDEQVTLRDSSGQIEDAVVWENRNGTWSRGEDKDVIEITEAEEWDSDQPEGGIDSTQVEREMVIARNTTQDTDSAADWFVAPFATPGLVNSSPPTRAEEVQIWITEVATKNSENDYIKIMCQDCGESARDLTGFSLFLSEEEVFSFPPGFQLTTGGELKIIFGAEEDVLEEGIFHTTRHGLKAADGLLELRDFAGNIVDFVGWSDGQTLPNQEQDLSEADQSRLAQIFTENQWDSDQAESLLDSTLVERGGFILRTGESDTNSAADFVIQESELDIVEIETMTGAVRISEILANPDGEDNETTEWLELANNGDEAVQLFGWQIFLNEKYFKFEEDIILQPGESKALYGLFSLLNSGATVTLLDPDGVLIDVVEYPEASAGIAFARSATGWAETSIPTPDAANSFYQLLASAEDSDADGLSDELELELQTDPERFDTDGDLLPDYFEVHRGLDPTQVDSSDAKLQQYRSELASLVDSQLDCSADSERGVFLSGVGLPGGRVKIYLHSELQIVEVPVSEEGYWSYLSDTELEAGDHNVFIQLIDPNGFEGVSKKILTFNLSESFEPPVFPEQIRISEVLANPEGEDKSGEFIELENFSSMDADLSNFQLTVGRKTFTFPSGFQISAESFAVLDYQDTKIALPNSGAQISLALPTGRVISSLGYGKQKDDIALAFDGTAFQATEKLTPGMANEISITTTKSRSSQQEQYRNGDISTDIQISEILANPEGKDDTEWVELWNSGDTAVNLGNWRLDDAEGGSKAFVIPDTFVLQPNEFKLFPRSLTKLSLNNSGDEVRLFDFRGDLVASFAFDDTSESKSIALDTDGVMRETEMLTPGLRNQFETTRIVGDISDVSEQGFWVKDMFIAFSEEHSGLLAQALIQKGKHIEVFARETDGKFFLKDFSLQVELSLLSSDLIDIIEHSKNKPVSIFSLLVFVGVLLILRRLSSLEIESN